MPYVLNAVRLGGPRVPQAPNAGPQPRLEAGARHERRLEGVGCRPMLGSYAAAQPSNGKELLSVSGLLLIPS